MALYHVFNDVDHAQTGASLSGVQVRVKYDDTEIVAPIYADQNGTDFEPANYCVTDADGMYSFYIAPGEYKLEFLVGSQVIKTIRDFRPAEVGPTGPAQNTYLDTAGLEESNVALISAVLAESGKAGTFTIRDYADFTAEVAADTGKVNYIQSTSDATKVWVRTSILSDQAAKVGTATGSNVQAELDANAAAIQVVADDLANSPSAANKANASALGVSAADVDMGAFTGAIIPSGSTAKAAIQAVADVVESTPSAATKVNASAVGVAATDANMGTTPGTILSDNGTAKDWFQESEAAIEGVKVVTDPLATTGTAQTLPKRTARINFPSQGPGAMFAFGTNGPNAGANYNGLQFGGGDAEWGSEGVFAAPDGHSSWLRFTPSRNYSPLELVHYTSGAQGTVQTQSGTNQVLRTFGSAFTSAWIGRKIYIGDSTYKVATVTDANNLTVTTTGGGAVSFGSTTTYVFHVFFVYGTGTCNISGTTVTHVTGDPFLAFATDASHELKINGTTRAVASSSGAPNTLTLSVAPGDATGATYEFWTDIDNTMVQERWQKRVGSSEENLTIGVKPWGYFLRTQISGAGSHYPLTLASGANKGQITLQPDGRIQFGRHGRIIDPTADTYNYLEMDTSVGGAVSLRARGPGSAAAMSFDNQGQADFQFTTGSFGKTVFFIRDNGGTDRLEVSNTTGAPALTAAGASANAGIRIVPKGTGAAVLADSSNNSKVAANSTGVGFNGSAPIAKPALGAVATDLATALTLVNNIRAALINYGLATA